MGWKSNAIRPYAAYVSAKIKRMAANAAEDQKRIRQEIVRAAAHTVFGQDHRFSSIETYADFKNQIPIRDYEEARSYFDRIRDGASNITWPGRPKYFALTSGTTSGAKYIPITKDSLPNHFNSARDALFYYGMETGNLQFLDGSLIFLSGSPELSTLHGVPSGRLSGIVNHEVPGWLKKNQVPTWETNCIDDWEKKVDAIVAETKGKDMRLISGIPPWVQMYYERLLKATGKETVKDIFPNYSVFVYGGVNYEPYRNLLEDMVGSRIDSVETYPASEGFFAFQDRFPHEGLLLNTRSGIFFEFIPLKDFGKPDAPRISLEEVETGVNYALVINSNAGLWGYLIGDTVRFLSVNPYRCVVTGRIKHFISAFGEHVIGKEVEEALRLTLSRYPASVTEFTVAPRVNPGEGLPYHEWFIEFGEAPDNIIGFSGELNQNMRKQNSYYDDLISGNILRPLQIRIVRKDAFRDFMKSRGKLGGQNKVPRLANDREYADALEAM